ncbi:type I polyketide synthase [Streptomyces resistomycificus]|uniref:type I polyketide synthase n=2 Tax=Streptomyces resistomycificus TaxID=67356 RepID=UPI00099C8513|nr:type I polyketide synthase [Streptomyces resistomycificus]
MEAQKSTDNSSADLAAAVRSELSARLGMDPAALRDDVVFSAYGLDSLKAVGFVEALGELMGRKLSATLPWECPTVERLVARLLGGPAPEPTATGAMEGPGVPVSGEPVAVVGMACRFPGADDIDQFWRLLSDGADLTGPVPPGRRTPVAGPREAGYLRGPVDQFDPLFFGISPREAQEMDPQQSLFLEVAWEALDAAGLGDGSLAGSPTGVFVGAIWHDYANLGASDGPASAYLASGRSLNMIANRFSYALGLRGPSLVVDTACSSSLLAVHLACQSLATGESKVAVVGGVNLLLDPRTTEALQGFGALAPDGRCKVFDESADGFGRGEGCGVVVLKPLSRALADNDRIWCVIRGSAANNDGQSNGLTAPNPVAQQEVLSRAYETAAVDAREVAYVETHGTGTVLGDPIEASALGAVLTVGRQEDAPDLVLGSVKANIGHLEGAAGIAGLMKAALCLWHRQIPSNPHFETPNAHIDFEGMRLRVPRENEAWPQNARPLAGVSAFGFGGTNVHVVLEGRDEPSLRELPPASAPEPVGQPTAPPVDGPNPDILFVCSPHGHQYAEMGVELMRAEPVFRAAVEECDRYFVPLAGWSLAEKLATGSESRKRLDVVLPLLYAVQVGLARLLEHHGVRPASVVGHCIGEIPAAVIAGILDVEQGTALVYHYSRYQYQMARPDHGMAALEYTAAEAHELVGDDDRVTVAACNGPRSTVISGDRARLEELVAATRAAGAQAGMIDVDVAGHGPAIEQVIEDLVRDIGELRPRPGRIPLISSVTAEPLDWREVNGAYFAQNLRCLVRFDDAVRRAMTDGASVLLEITAHAVLLHALRQLTEEAATAATGDDRSPVALGTMRRGDPRGGLSDALAALRALGWQPEVRDERTAQLLTLSARSPEALLQYAGETAGALRTATPETTVADVCRATARRTAFPYRLAAVGRDLPGLAADLERLAQGGDAEAAWASEQPAAGRPRTAFVFPGPGSQWPGTARSLLAEEPVFAAVLRECDAKAAPLLGRSLLEELNSTATDGQPNGPVQPLLFSVQVALAELWRSWGVEPDVVIGHGVGEVAAACTSGALTLDDGLRITCLGSVLSDSPPEELRAELSALRPTAGRVPIHSTVLNQRVDGSGMDAAYWCDTLREPPAFPDGVRSLLDDGNALFVEISPDPVLTSAIDEAAAHAGRRVTVVPSLRRDEDGRAVMLGSLGAAHLAGAEVDGSAALRPGARRQADLPAYPWQRQHFPIPGLSGADREARSGYAAGTGLVLGARLDSAVEPGVHYWQTRLSAEIPEVADHQVRGTAVVPGSAYLALAAAAVDEVRPGAELGVSDLLFASVLAPEAGRPRLVQSVWSQEGGGARFRVFDRGGATPLLLAEAVFRAEDRTPDEHGPLHHGPLRHDTELSMPDALTEDGFYRLLADHGVECGPEYRRVTAFRAVDGGAVALATLTAQDLAMAGTRLPRAAYDAAFQTVTAAVLGGGDPDGTGMVLVEGADSISFAGKPSDTVSVHVRLEADGAGGTRADVRMLDAAGGDLMELRGLRVRRSDTLRIASPAVEPGGFAQAPESARPAAADERGPEPLTADPAEVESIVRTAVARIVDTSPERLRVDQPFREFGMDSLMAVELRKRLERKFGVKLSSSLAFNYPTVQELVPYLIDKAGLSTPRRDADTQRPPEPLSPGSPNGSALQPGVDDADSLLRELELLEARIEDL